MLNDNIHDSLRSSCLEGTHDGDMRERGERAREKEVPAGQANKNCFFPLSEGAENFHWPKVLKLDERN